MNRILRRRVLRMASWTISALVLLVAFQALVRDGKTHDGKTYDGTQHYERKEARPPVDVSTDLAMKRLDGEPLRLSDYHGKVILLNFWASWCPPCRDEIPRFAQWQTQLGGQGLQVIGITMDDYPADAEKAIRELGINYPVVVGNAKIADHFGGIYGLPFTLVLGRNGQIVSRRPGLADLPSLERLLRTQLAMNLPEGKP